MKSPEADLKSCTALGSFGTTAVTALTAQNSFGATWTAGTGVPGLSDYRMRVSNCERLVWKEFLVYCGISVGGCAIWLCYLAVAWREDLGHRREQLQ